MRGLKIMNGSSKLAISSEEAIIMKKVIWKFCERTMSGNANEGELAILPRMLESYVAFFGRVSDSAEA